jgi:hypothetical protein
MAELAIIGNEWTEYGDLVQVERVTDARLYYSFQNGYGRPTYCAISRVKARNATPELFQKLKSMEGDHKRRKKEVEKQMDEQFKERCQKAIIEAVTTN